MEIKIMENKLGKTAPKREDRLKACVTYGGTLCGLRNKLSGGCFKDGERSFSQGNICLMLPGAAMLGTLPDNVNVLHGAVGCGASFHAQNANIRSGSAARFGAAKDGIWVSTAMNEADVIAGGEEKLRRAIIEADRAYSPKTITVIASCVPGITGDDVDGVIDGVRPLVAARIIPVHCEGFKTKIWATAYDAVYHGIMRTVFEGPDAGAGGSEAELAERADLAARKDVTVNLCNVSSMGKVDEDELTRLLNAMGLRVNVFPGFAEPETLYRLKYAALNISTCPTHDDYFMKFFEEKFQIPYILRHMPIGIANTTAWLLDVASFFHKEEEARKVAAAETAKLDAALVPYRAAFRGKKAFVNAGEFRALANGALLHELGFEIAGIRSFHHDGFAEPEYEKLHGTIGDFSFNVANCQPFEEANLLKKMQPDIFMGHCNGNGTAAKLGIPSHVIFNSNLSYIGYKGVFELARRLRRQLSNPAFVRNLAAFVRLPYKESWYAENPFKYIKEES
jgi:nitrogenase molybdenum-iron protein alpha chain